MLMSLPNKLLAEMEEFWLSNRTRNSNSREICSVPSMERNSS